MFLGRWEPTSLRRRQNDQNTLKFGQKHHFYATILARRRQNGPRRRQTLKSGEPTSPDPGVSTGMGSNLRSLAINKNVIVHNNFFNEMSELLFKKAYLLAFLV